MLIKIITGSEETGWIPHTRKSHKIMLTNPPERIQIRIRDFYVKSPDKDKTEVISFELFNLLARRFFLDQEAEQKQDSRNLDDREIDGCRKAGFDMNEYMRKMDELDALRDALNMLTETQRRRVRMHFFGSLTYEQIAGIEGVDEKAVRNSVKQAIKKLKNIFMT